MHDKAIKIIEQIRKKVSSIEGVVALIILANFFLYLTLLIYSHQNFFTFNEGDKGIMYQMYYNTVIHGDIFYSSIQGGSALYNRYILVLFLPFMYLYPNIPVTFSVISTALLSLGALPVYWLATDVAKSKRIGLLFVGLYFLYPSLGWLMLESVKEEIFVLPFLLFAFYYMHVKSYPKSMLFLFLAVICKQNMLLVLPMFAIYAFLENYDKKWIAGPVAISVGWFISLQFILRPYFSSLAMGLSGSPAGSADTTASSGIALTASLPSFSSFTGGRYGWMGSTFSEIFTNLVANPFLFIEHLITPENIFYLALLFIPLCGISLLKPKVLLLGLPIFLQNLLATSAPMKMITWHYVSTLVFVVLTGAILAFPILYRRLNNEHRKLFVLILLIVSILSFFTYGPVVETMHNIHNSKSYGERLTVQFDYLGATSENKGALQAVFNEIPDESLMMATYHFGPYLYKHKNVSYFGWSKEPFHENYDYYLLRIDMIRTYPRYNIMQKILQRSDICIKYYDGRYIVLGTGEQGQGVNKKDLSKLSISGFKSQPRVGHTHYDDTIGESVFFSSKLTNSAGYLAYGPYIGLPAGNYTIEYIIKAENLTSLEDLIARIDIFSTYVDGSTPAHVIDARRDVYKKDLIEGNFTPISLDVSVDKYNPERLIEFRVFQPLNSDLYVKEINILTR
ncbi:MAG: DUF2079 domain-containing protein [Methanoculleus marisnigri]|nr:DUF2079 domain-containing protein [Methanoculleus marisnigri]